MRVMLNFKSSPARSVTVLAAPFAAGAATAVLAVNQGSKSIAVVAARRKTEVINASGMNGGAAWPYEKIVASMAP
jgi:hypothetical protein